MNEESTGLVMIKIELWLHVKGTDDQVFIERIIDLPFAPWVGLGITGLTNENSNLCEHTVRSVWWDYAKACFIVMLEPDDSDDTGRTSQEIVDTDYPSEWIRQE